MKKIYIKKSEPMLRLEKLFGRREKTSWSQKEKEALRKIGDIDDEDLSLLERFYFFALPANTDDDRWLRKNLQTLLNNYNGELDKARLWLAKNDKTSYQGQTENDY